MAGVFVRARTDANECSAAYCASKGAVVLLTKQIAVDYASEKIHCNALCPGCKFKGTSLSPVDSTLLDFTPDSTQPHFSLPIFVLSHNIKATRPPISLPISIHL